MRKHYADITIVVRENITATEQPLAVGGRGGQKAVMIVPTGSLSVPVIL